MGELKIKRVISYASGALSINCRT